MDRIAAPDGVSLAYELRGDGPLVALVPNCLSPPDVLEGLFADLARDHTVLTYHPRGFGESDRVGPWDPDTDAGDLLAVLEQADAPAVLLAVGNSCNVAVRAATRSPERAAVAVCQYANPLGQQTGVSGSFVASEAVLEMTRTMAANDYRAFLSSIIGSMNPQLDPAGLSERVERHMEYAEPDAVRTRSEVWVQDSFGELAEELGERFVMLWHDGNPWVPRELFDRLRIVLPEARLFELEDGPVSRPDLTAEVIRSVTADSRWPARTA